MHVVLLWPLPIIYIDGQCTSSNNWWIKAYMPGIHAYMNHRPPTHALISRRRLKKVGELDGPLFTPPGWWLFTITHESLLVWCLFAQLHQEERILFELKKKKKLQYGNANSREPLCSSCTRAIACIACTRVCFRFHSRMYVKNNLWVYLSRTISRVRR